MRKCSCLVCLVLFLCVSCSHIKNSDYVWIETINGYKIWIESSQLSYSYSWDGENIDGIAHGSGCLTIYRDGNIIESSQKTIYYGAVNKESVLEVSSNEIYIGEIKEKKYNGYGVLIKKDEVLIGHFVESKANGFCSYYKNGNVAYRGMWKEHQLHGEGVQYSHGDSICGIWNNGKLIKAKVTQNTKNGTFSGYVENNLPNGLGKMEYTNGWTYNGEWQNGYWNGTGELNTSLFVYSGEWLNNKPQGDGIVSFVDGGYYDGNWKDGKREGWGDAYNSDGTYYVGEWLNGEYDGQGSFYFSDNSYYDGQWQNGLQHGLGLYVSENFTYVGQWEEGWINGEGRMEYNNGDVYEGNFIENKRYGLGYYHFKEGNSYEGEFVDDVFNGLGRFCFQDGTLYEGEFQNGKICGDGTYYYIDGKDTIAITANWNGSSAFPKLASILFSNGDVYEGEIVNGKPTQNGIWYPCQSSWAKDMLVSANDCYKLHKETIDKAVIITSLSLTVVATAAATIASAGAGAPALAATVSALTTVANTANTINTAINVADIAATVSSSAIDENWEGVATEVAINAAFIFVPKGVTKVLTSKPARKAAVKLSQSAVSKTVRKSVITISKSKPYKKISTVIIDKSGKISNAFVSSTKSNLEKFAKSKTGRKLESKYAARQREIGYGAEQMKKMRHRSPNNNKHGKWTGVKANSEYVRNLDDIVTIQGESKTVREWAKELGIPEIKIKYRDGYPDFINVKDIGTKTGKPLKCSLDEGIERYLNHDELISQSSKVNRENLHEEVYKRLAKQQGKTVDEIKVFKGDEQAVNRLMQKWKCSKQEVLNRCDNPKYIKRVLHECEDRKTVVLVPEIYHKGIAHDGGVEAAKRMAQNLQ